MTDTRFVLGVDGGGSTTTAWLARVDGDSLAPCIVGKGSGGPANATATHFENAAKSVDHAIRQAAEQAQTDLSRVNMACLAMAGSEHNSVKRSWTQWAHEQGMSRCLVTSDVEAVIAAGCPSRIGVALISGTGSIACGRNSKNEHVRVGGWGHLISDRGSGYWIARQALKAIVRAEDRVADETRLKGKFLDELQVDSVNELVRKASLHDKCIWASWSKLVFEAAAQDSVADDILSRAISCLSQNVQAVVEQLGLTPRISIALAGGVLIHNDSFRSSLIEDLAQSVGPLDVSLITEPVSGAVALAIKQLDA